MKIFRRSFLKAYTSTFAIPFMIILSVVFALLLYFFTYTIWACLMFLSIMALLSFPIFFIRYVYVILTDEKLIFKNGIYTFWSKEYLYGDIMKVEIRPGADASMKVTTKIWKKIPRSYCIDLVDPKDNDELASMIKAKGVIVEFVGIDIYWPGRKLNKNQKADNCCATEMKVFRRSFWSAYLTRSIFIPFLLVLILIIPDVISKFGFLYTGVGAILACCFYFFIFLFFQFYVLLFDDMLVVKNGIFFFWKRKVYYEDIVKVNIIYLGGYTMPYMQIITGKTRLAWRYYLDRVRRKDFPKLIASLRENGVRVDVEGMDFFKI